MSSCRFVALEPDLLLWDEDLLCLLVWLFVLRGCGGRGSGLLVLLCGVRSFGLRVPWGSGLADA